jgi:hypothetical protein
MRKELEKYKIELQQELENILAYWIKYTVDYKYGGFAVTSVGLILKRSVSVTGIGFGCGANTSFFLHERKRTNTVGKKKPHFERICIMNVDLV